MQRHGVLFVRDPVVSLDLAEILAAALHPIQLYFPTSAKEAATLLGNATCIVTDTTSGTELRNTLLDGIIPQLHVGADEETMRLSDIFARIDQPFTNTSVIEALTALGLV